MMKALLETCCGLDIHKETIEACIVTGPLDQEPTLIRKSFSTLRGDLFRLRDWLATYHCKHIAMESTGVYWKPVYDVLEEVEEITLFVVNAHHIKNVPGRKTDIKDAQWIAELMRCGLLTASFVPEKDIRTIREYTRFYRKVNEQRTKEVVRIEKFLQTHGFKLSSVISDINGFSGKKILYELANYGSISEDKLTEVLHHSIKKSPEEIAYALNGSLTPFEQKLLRRMLSVLAVLEKEVAELRAELEEVSASIKESIDLVDTVPGVDRLAATYLLAEISDNMDSFPTDGHICSWAGLSPRNNESAGKKKHQNHAWKQLCKIYSLPMCLGCCTNEKY